jgi:hypothetical protein
MEPTLIGVTLVSLAMAASMSLVVWRLLREERRRSDARVAALTEMARTDVAPAAEPGGLRIWRDEPYVEDDRVMSESVTSGGTSDLFAVHESPSPLGRRLMVAGILLLMIGGGISAAIVLRGVGTEAAESPSTAAGHSTSLPLELIALRHAREAGTMTITGLVQNPRAGAPLRRVTAVAFLFDKDGAFVSSGKALLDFMALDPGEESPFVITIAGAGNVARYRIGFRTEEGHVLAHVDRRP